MSLIYLNTDAIAPLPNSKDGAMQNIAKTAPNLLKGVVGVACRRHR
ncbi:MAG: hypothetical protein V7L11_24970 [Nostoc sp.]